MPSLFTCTAPLVFFLVGAGAALGQSGAGATPQEPQKPTSRVLIVGTHLRMPLPKEAARLAVGDESILSVQLLNTREALILGLRTGTTTMLAWYDDGSYEPMLFRVQRDLSLLQSSIDEICAGVVVEMAPDRDALVLRGTVPDVACHREIVRIAGNYLGAGSVSGAAGEGDSGSRGSGCVIDLLRLATRPTSLEERILAAIEPIAGDDIRVRRLQKNPLSNDEEDVLVLEGSVADQIALVRSMQLAARLFLGEEAGTNVNRNAIQVLADEAGGLLGGPGQQNGQGGGGQGGGGFGQGGGGLNGGGGAGGFAGGGGVGVRQNQVQRNLARATVLSMAKGRILSFVEVRDRPQVRLSVKMFEIDRDRLFQFASEIQTLVSDFPQPVLEPSQVGTSIQPTPANVGAFSDTDVQAGLASLANGFSQQTQISGRQFALDLLLQALEARGIARRLSNPVITVLNGETAQFQVGGEIPVPQAFTPAAGGASGLGTFASVDFRAFGVGLGVRPLVGRAGEVTLDLSSIVSQPDEVLTTVVRNATGTDPQTTAFATRALQTNARLQDGESLLVGGLVSHAVRNDVSKTPLLGDLPLLGWLFRSTNESFAQSELFVLVSPSIVRPRVPGSGLWMHPGLAESLATCTPPRQEDSDDAESEDPGSGDGESAAPAGATGSGADGSGRP